MVVAALRYLFTHAFIHLVWVGVVFQIQVINISPLKWIAHICMELLMLLTLLLSVIESPGEGSREGDSTGVRFGHDSVQGAKATWEPWTAEVRWWGHHRGHQVPAGEAGRECAGSQVPSGLHFINSMQSLKTFIQS